MLKSLNLFALIINLANKNSCGAQDWPLFLLCKLSLQKLLPFFGKYQAYTISWKLQERYGLLGHLVTIVIELLKLPLQR